MADWLGVDMANATCSVEGCIRTPHYHAGYGMCSMHYTRLVRTGDVGGPEPERSRPGAAQERFEKYVDRSGNCWLWTGRTSGGGYGQMKIAGRVAMAHRLAHEFYVGPIPDGYEVDHLCRVRLCVNPAHLEAVTPEENRARRDAYHRVPGRAYNLPTCGKGHLLAGENLRVRPSRPQQKACRTCEREHRQAAKARKQRRAGGATRVTPP